MPETILITGDSASGKSFLACYIASRLDDKYVVFQSVDGDRRFMSRFCAAGDSAPPVKSPVSVTVIDDLPRVPAWKGADFSCPDVVDDFFAANSRTDVLIVVASHLWRVPSRFMAHFDTVLYVQRDTDGERVVKTRKCKEAENSPWAGRYSVQVKSTPFFARLPDPVEPEPVTVTLDAKEAELVREALEYTAHDMSREHREVVRELAGRFVKSRDEKGGE